MSLDTRCVQLSSKFHINILVCFLNPVMLSWWSLINTNTTRTTRRIRRFCFLARQWKFVQREIFKMLSNAKRRLMKMAKVRQNCANSAEHELCGQGSSNATVCRFSVLTCTRCCQHSISHWVHIWYCIKGAPMLHSDLQLVEGRLNGPHSILRWRI